MKKMKKFFAVLLALAMVLGMSMTTFAAGVPSASDAKDVTVQGLEAGASVTAYQIIDAEYNSNGFTDYVWTANSGKTGAVQFTKDSNNNDVVVGLTSDYITNLANSATKPSTTVEATVAAGATTATLKLTAGSWMIIVTPPASNAAKIYNPMVASVYYTVSGSDNTMGGDGVSAGTNWTLETTGAYSKSSDITLTKSVNDDTREVGQEVTFKITTTIPSYSKAYTNATFTVKDEIVKGLAYTTADPVVKVGGVTVEAKNYTLTKTDNYFTVAFTSNYLRGLATAGTNRSVEITYTATVTAAAVESNAENKATLTYSDTISTTATKEDTEKVFTFKLDGVLKKVKEDQQTALAGAEFTLYRDSALTEATKFGTYTTTADGNIKFEGVGAKDPNAANIETAEVKYYLKETKAPDGYSLNDTVYTIEIKDIVRDNNGDVTEYSVYVDGTSVATVTLAGAVTGNGVSIINTTLSTLPSTGGIGTMIFTVGGCLIMILAAVLFFASRRKSK